MLGSFFVLVIITFFLLKEGRKRLNGDASDAGAGVNGRASGGAGAGVNGRASGGAGAGVGVGDGDADDGDGDAVVIILKNSSVELVATFAATFSCTAAGVNGRAL